MNFAVNVLGTYGMTELLVPLLEKSQPYACVITVASGRMYTTPLTTDVLPVANLVESRSKLATNGYRYLIFMSGIDYINIPFMKNIRKKKTEMWKVSNRGGKMDGAERLCAWSKWFGLTHRQFFRLMILAQVLMVALTEKWAQKYGDKGIGFYAIHLGWVATAGVAMSLSSFSKSEMCLCVC
ncbi:putative NAD(P)-binding domain superfamily [Helianthus anomalus]